MTSSAPSDAARRRHRNERIVAAIVVLLCAGAATGLIWWNNSVRRELASDLSYIPKPVPTTPEMLLLQELVRIDTSTPAGAAEGARWVAAYLEKHGIPAEIIASAPDRLNVYARIRGRQRGGALLLFNHIDVVPPGGEWPVPPFEGRIVGDVLIGRGTLDMKGLIICQLLAMVDIHRSGTPPEHDVVFLSTADEETGSDWGMKWIIANRRDVLEGVEFGITEGGITEMMKERMTYFGVEVGGKQVVEMTLEASSIEALQRARIALEPYIFPRDPGRVLPAVRQYMREIAPTRIAFRDYLSDIDKTIAEGEFWRLPSPYRDLTQRSVHPAAPSCDTSGRCSMFVRIVNLPDEPPAPSIAWLESVMRPYGVRIAQVHRQEGPVPISSADSVLFRLLTSEAARRYDVTAGSILLYRSATDARFLRPLGITCYGITPFPVDYFQSLTIHKTNERIGLARFTEGVAYVRTVVSAWARQS